MNLFDPPPTRQEYLDEIEPILNRPLTSPVFGEGSASRRSRCSRLSALMMGRERERRRVVESPWTGKKYLV